LFLGTALDNQRDMAAKGRSARGERNAQAKITAADVREIRRRHLAGATQSSLCGDFGLRRNAMSALVTGKTWRHVGLTHAGLKALDRQVQRLEAKVA
jgi:hypothetical protein